MTAATKIDRVVRVIEEEAPDLICLQEVTKGVPALDSTTSPRSSRNGSVRSPDVSA